MQPLSHITSRNSTSFGFNLYLKTEVEYYSPLQYGLWYPQEDPKFYLMCIFLVQRPRVLEILFFFPALFLLW